MVVSPPVARSFCATAFALFLSRPISATRAPARANSTAHAAPSPEVAPVIMTALPAKLTAPIPSAAFPDRFALFGIGTWPFQEVLRRHGLLIEGKVAARVPQPREGLGQRHPVNRRQNLHQRAHRERGAVGD